MSESTLTSTFADIQQIAGLEMGWGRTADNWTTANDTDFAIACKEGYREFLYPQALPGERKSHNWSFLYPLGDMTIGSSSYSTGTIDIQRDSGMPTGATRREVTLDGGSWPTWAVDNYLWYTENSVVYKEKVVDDDWDNRPGVVYVDISAQSLLAGHAYELVRANYELPDDFGGMVSDSFTYRRDEQWHLPQIKIVGEAEIRKADRANSGEVYPRYATIVPLSPVSATEGSGGNSTRWVAQFYPRPEQTYYLEYRYHAIPPALDEDSNIYHYGGAEHSQTIIAAVIDALYRRIHASNEKREEFLNRLRQSILHDRRNYQPGNLGRGTGYEYGREALRGFRESTPTGNITTTFY